MNSMSSEEVDWKSIAEKSQRVVENFVTRQDDPFRDYRRMGEVFMDAYVQMLRNPEKLAEAQHGLWKQYMGLWQTTARRMMGEEVEAQIKPEPHDRRFKDSEWSDNAVFDHIKQTYLLGSHWLRDLMSDVDGLDDKTAHKLDFFTRLFVDALSPTNFALTNPEVLRCTAETGGDNLVKGLENFLDDLDRGKGRLAVRMVDEDSFTVGKDLATTPGKVVFRSELFELIQYAPTTEKVHRKPFLIVPPWINKFYILDLKPQNSFVRWVVEQGHTVFVVSWVNPDSGHADVSFEDYMTNGLMKAVDAVLSATGEKRLNVLGYCIGGTLLACTLAHMAAIKDNRVASATFLTTLVDFEDVGDIGVFIDEEQIVEIENSMEERGYLEGSDMASTFTALRVNDLLWSFVINNYLKGRDPVPFDILYWNSDSTRLPAAMHSYYLRNLYLENKLVEPGGIELGGTPIELQRIRTPAYMLSTADDHIAPWKSTYVATRHFRGPTVFTLAKSGHVAGVVNPPVKNKYGYWTNTENPHSADEWFTNAKVHDGSWWAHWNEWLVSHAGAMVNAREPGSGNLPAICDAPGTYVMVDLRKTAKN